MPSPRPDRGGVGHAGERPADRARRGAWRAAAAPPAQRARFEPAIARAALAIALSLVAAPAAGDAGALAAGNAAAERDDRAEAARQYEQAYRSFESTLGQRDPLTIESMRKTARMWRALGRLAEAVPLNERAAELMTEVFGERNPDTIDAFGELASVYGQLGRRTEQLRLNEQVLARRIEVLGPRARETLSTMNNLALTYSALGRLAEAVAMSERAAAVAEETLGPADPARLSIVSNLAHNYGLIGRLPEQLALNERLLAMRTEAFGERAPGTLISLHNLAYSYHLAGRQDEALQYNERALALRTQVLGERHPDTLFTMSNLGQVYARMGRYADALALVERLLPLRLAVLGPRHADTLITRNDLANLYVVRGRGEEAVAQYEQALQIYRETVGERVPSALAIMSNLARTLRVLGRDVDATATAERGLQLRREALGERHPDTLQGMHELATIHLQAGRTAEALALSRTVLAARTEVLGEGHPDTLAITAQLGEALAAAGRIDEALALARKALDRQAATLGASHPDTLNSLDAMARQLAATGRRADAVALAERYVEGAERLRNQPGLSAEDRRGIFQKHAQVYRRLSADSGAIGDLALGFRLAELSKARTLLDSMTAQRAGRSGALPAADQARLDDLGRQIAAHDLLIARTRVADSRLNLETARNVLVRRYETLESELKSRFPRYALAREPRLLDASAVRGVIPPDAVAISYMVTADGSVTAWLVLDAGTVRFADLGRIARLGDAVEALRLASSDIRGIRALEEEHGQRAWRLPDGSYRLLDAGAPAPDGAVAVTDEAEIAGYLGRRLLAPLAELLRGRRHWIVSPDGPLARLPFELLSFDGARVVDAIDLHYAQSLSVYALARARQVEYRSLPARSRDLLALGDPDYGPSAPAAGSRRARLRSAPLPGDEALSGAAFAWPSLPGTAVEIQAIRALLPKSEAWMREEASESHLQELDRSGELANYRILHFAVHGRLSDQEPALSSLVLSQRNLAPGTDGHVTAAEWPAYTLRSDLTVLSACETGLGRNLSGEGVMGLPFGLFLAGNVNTVLTLWPVLDEATPLFMQRFYAHLQAGQGAAEALAATKREMAAEPRTRHPVHWAAFILIGAG